MNRRNVYFLQVIIVLIGVAAIAVLLWQPQVEGVNRNKSNVEIYFQDPLVAFVFTGSIPFFVALYQAILALGHVGRNQAYSPEVVTALRLIKYCAIVIIGFVVLGELYIVLSGNRDEENPGVPLFLGLLILFPSVVVAAVAGLLERILQNVVDMKSEYELTV